MFNAAHVLEVALLLLAAFLVGAVAGSLLRAMVQGLQGQRESAGKPHVAHRVPRVFSADPIPSAPVPEATSEQPETVAVTVDPAPAVPPDAADAAADATTQREDAAESENPLPTAQDPEPAVAAVTLPEAVEPETSAGASESPSGVEAEHRIEAASTEPAEAAAPAPEVQGPGPAPERAEPEPAAAPDPAPAKRPVIEVDEFAAMRAIEGNWAPRRPPHQRRPPPQVTGLAGTGVASDTSGRLRGLPAPRNGRKDNLTHVIGILPVIETSLNSMGIYHFDQVAEFSDADVAWLEAHLGIEGRIDREQWRQQARELAVALRPKVEILG